MADYGMDDRGSILEGVRAILTHTRDLLDKTQECYPLGSTALYLPCSITQCMQVQPQ
jgi:hypothetical protein